MTAPTVTVDTGDVLAVRTRGVFPRLIDLGAFLKHEPHTADHIAIAHDFPPPGNLRVIEAEPGGVRLGPGSGYVGSRWTVTNAAQPKTAAQRQQVVAVAQSFLATPYDWAAISADAGNVFDLRDPWVRDWPVDGPPHRVVCSSLAAYVYEKVGLACPVGGRFVTPAQWVAFIDAHLGEWGQP